jgi:hypothetical protein
MNTVVCENHNRSSAVLNKAYKCAKPVSFSQARMSVVGRFISATSAA